MTAIEPTSKPEFSTPSDRGDRSNLNVDCKSPPSQFSQAFWAIFSTTFFTIFLAEMGDKTQLATLLIAAESRSPWVVFVGAAIALITTSLIGVSLGWWLSQRISQKAMDLAAAAILLLISVLLLWDVVTI